MQRYPPTPGPLKDHPILPRWSVLCFGNSKDGETFPLSSLSLSEFCPHMKLLRSGAPHVLCFTPRPLLLPGHMVVVSSAVRANAPQSPPHPLGSLLSSSLARTSCRECLQHSATPRCRSSRCSGLGTCWRTNSLSTQHCLQCPTQSRLPICPQTFPSTQASSCQKWPTFPPPPSARMRCRPCSQYR